MLRRTLLALVLGVSPLATLVAAGCSSNRPSEPNALTGSDTTISDAEYRERQRWTDDKGRYRADLRMAGGAPLRNLP
jgi:hypothetical protein